MEVKVNELPIKKKFKFRKILSRYSVIIKNILSSIKDTFIIITIILFIFRPQIISKFLESHQIETQEVKFFGIRLPFKSSLKEIEYQGDLQQLALLNINDTDLSFQKAATSTLSSSSKFVEELESNILTSKKFSKTKDWGAVISAHKNLDESNQFILSLKSINLSQFSRIYLRNGYYRVVLYYGDSEILAKALPEIKKTFPYAYIVSLTKWCSDDDNLNKKLSEGYFICKQNLNNP